MGESPNQNRGLILLYHRIVEPASDPQLLAVSPGRFADHLDVLRRIATPMSLRDMVAASRDRKLPARAVAITFDDGYADNLHTAAPLLARGAIPATIFIATGYLDGQREFWWDAVERMLLHDQPLPQTLELTAATKVFCRRLDPDARGLAGTTHSKWNVLQPSEATPRQKLYMELCEWLRPLDPPAQADCLHVLAEWSHTPRSPRPEVWPLRRDELQKLRDFQGITLGAHTVNHPVLSALPEPMQRAEIQASKCELETILNRPVHEFSYPYGTRRDYDATTLRLVGEAGFECTVANYRGTVGPETDPMRLPRIVIRDWDGDVFERRLLEEWSRG